MGEPLACASPLPACAADGAHARCQSTARRSLRSLGSVRSTPATFTTALRSVARSLAGRLASDVPGVFRPRSKRPPSKSVGHSRRPRVAHPQPANLSVGLPSPSGSATVVYACLLGLRMHSEFESWGLACMRGHGGEAAWAARGNGTAAAASARGDLRLNYHYFAKKQERRTVLHGVLFSCAAEAEPGLCATTAIGSCWAQSEQSDT
ncbi:hypothetical protein GGX14DRAFT_609602 [Mycena pura]|uniref:Uncharacterized protein n=1 Tax=Mycena pura TaxID=153505 RepID=A0AAD6VKJ4_9AGAR|nr:hypothetical protein GGX14DRAFT_609602 [Mycena pura]